MIFGNPADLKKMKRYRKPICGGRWSSDRTTVVLEIWWAYKPTLREFLRASGR